PKENRDIPPLRHDWAWRLKRERPDLEVVVNGGIADADTASGQLRHLDGVMLGRAAYHMPWLLHELDRASCRVALFVFERIDQRQLLFHERLVSAGEGLEHLVDLAAQLGLFAGQRGGRAFRQVLSEGAHRPGADWSLIEQALERTR
ncbi:tRNA dihydrouridine(20/20a) synthase DusA, partial [Bacillus tequilensis]|nr:tRNA dihydrouridine(20/20a) synthase DusA [Bacillus tequilensis]